MTSEIPLTRGLVALVDDEDFEAVSGHKWCATYCCNRFYAHTGSGAKRLYLHRFLMNPGPGMETDHINNDGLDNRRCNLRVCTRSQNNQNRAKARGTSRFKGVDWDKGRNRWRAQIGHEGKHIFLGRFANEEEAARAYNKAAILRFGEFARGVLL